MNPLEPLEKDVNACSKAIDKKKFTAVLEKKLPKFFLPLEQTKDILKAQAKYNPRANVSEREYNAFISLMAGWKLNKKIFTIPPEVLEGFIDGGDTDMYENKSFQFPNSILELFPYWTNCVKVNRNVRTNIKGADDEDIFQFDFTFDYLLYAVREYEGNKYLYFNCYVTRLLDGESLQHTVSGCYDINSTETNSVSEFQYDADKFVDENYRVLNKAIMNVINPTVINIIMYVATMNKHRPTPFSIAEAGVKKMGNKLFIPNPSVREVEIGDHVIKVVEGDKVARRGMKTKLKTHMRRGFWRRQWYGPLNKPEERTMDLVYIPPCIVRGFNEE